MDKDFRLFPDAASSAAARTDALYLYLCSVTFFFTVLIFLLIVYFAIKHRRRDGEAPPYVPTNNKLEALWLIIPLILALVMFFWGARVYFYIHRPPETATDIHVVGKQWMWKIQHPNGKREINELHLPLGRAIRVTLASQDVIHSFFIPAFRVKQDALPGRYTKIWFRPTRLGTYHLFCAEYCGTDHSAMIGRVVVTEPERYQAWLVSTPIEDVPSEAGERLFRRFECDTCHGIKAPTLARLYGSEVTLADGSRVTADDDYLRESILDSTAAIVAGYAPIMPSYRGQITEEQLIQIIAYIRSLRDPTSIEKAH